MAQTDPTTRVGALLLLTPLWALLLGLSVRAFLWAAGI